MYLSLRCTATASGGKQIEYQMCLVEGEGACLIRLGLQVAFMPFLHNDNSWHHVLKPDF